MSLYLKVTLLSGLCKLLKSDKEVNQSRLLHLIQHTVTLLKTSLQTAANQMVVSWYNKTVLNTQLYQRRPHA